MIPLAADRLGVWDSGLAAASVNLGLDRCQRELALRRCGLLRFHRHRPAASLGAFEEARHALRPDYCRDHGIPVVRRLTGGGALYLDPDQLCWTLTLPLLPDAPAPRLGEWLAALGGAWRRRCMRWGSRPCSRPPTTSR